MGTPIFSLPSEETMITTEATIALRLKYQGRMLLISFSYEKITLTWHDPGGEFAPRLLV